MTISESAQGSRGRVTAIGGDDSTHRRLVDMGLLGGTYEVRFKRKRSMLVDFCDEFSVAVTEKFATQIEVTESNENRVMRQSERR